MNTWVGRSGLCGSGARIHAFRRRMRRRLAPPPPHRRSAAGLELRRRGLLRVASEPSARSSSSRFAPAASTFCAWISRKTSLRKTGTSRGAWMPRRTFSPTIDSTDTSMPSPIMMLWLAFRVSTSMGPPCAACANAWLDQRTMSSSMVVARVGTMILSGGCMLYGRHLDQSLQHVDARVTRSSTPWQSGRARSPCGSPPTGGAQGRVHPAARAGRIDLP